LFTSRRRGAAGERKGTGNGKGRCEKGGEWREGKGNAGKITHTHTHTYDLLANHIKHKVEKYRDGMLRGSEVSKDSYHSPVKKIKTIKNLQTKSRFVR